MNILYIEDDPGLAELAKRTLQKSTYHIDLAQDLAAAKSLIDHNTFDCILTDYVLPDGYGIDLMKEHKKKGSCVPWVVITALGDERLAVQAIKNGASDYVVKDIKASYLKLLPSILDRAIKTSDLERKKTISERKLADATNRLRLMFRSSFDLLLIYNDNWEILEISEQALEQYNEEPKKFIGKNLFRSMHFNTSIESLLRSNKKDLESLETNITVGEYNFPVHIRSKMLSDGSFLMSCRDLSEKHQLLSAKAATSLAEQDRDRYEASSIYMRQMLKKTSKTKIIGVSPKIKEMLTTIKQAAMVDASVLVNGETGAGKEMVADLLHEFSTRSDENIIKINCAALPHELVESELFGHIKGSFTGAYQNKIGRFEAAHKGTLVLDEIGEFPLTLQSKLLRALQSGEFQPIGSNETKQVDARVVALTNRNLKEMVEQGSFREDLFYRLNVIPILVPSLRDRNEDIPLLFDFFVNEILLSRSHPSQSIPLGIHKLIAQYHWPGNIRELRNYAERGLAIADWRLPTGSQENEKKNVCTGTIVTLADNEKNHILKALKQCNGVLSGKKGAAELLDINANTLRARMDKLGITLRKNHV